MKAPKTLLYIAALVFLSACATNSTVFSDYDPNQKFESYKRFAWSGEEPGLVSGTYPVSAIAKSKINLSIKAELEERGFIFTDDSSDADFLVSFTLGARDKIATRLDTQYRADPNAWRWGRAYYPYYFPDVVPVTVKETYQFTEGSIAVDIFDAKDNRPVWHSSASKRLSRKQLAGSENKQRETAKALLAGFPPQ